MIFVSERAQTSSDETVPNIPIIHGKHNVRTMPGLLTVNDLPCPAVLAG
jgi:hypothetical protein